MKLSLFFTGKTSSDYLEKGIAEYEKRIKRYIEFEIKTIKDIKASKSMPVKTVKIKEGEQILKHIKTLVSLLMIYRNMIL